MAKKTRAKLPVGKPRFGFQSFGGAEWGGGPAEDPSTVQFSFVLVGPGRKLTDNFETATFFLPPGCGVRDAAFKMARAWNEQTSYPCAAKAFRETIHGETVYVVRIIGDCQMAAYQPRFQVHVHSPQPTLNEYLPCEGQTVQFAGFSVRHRNRKN